MNDIPERQNSEPFLRLLRARSYLYAAASRLQAVQFVLTVVVPLLLGVVGLIVEQARPYVAVVALLITAADVAIVDRALRSKIKEAAKVSEQFDCDLLRMRWRTLIAGKVVAPESISSAARAWRKGNSELVDWYPRKVGRASLELARFVCQRSNPWYDSELREAYSGYIAIGAGVIGVVWLLAAVFMAQLSLLDLVVTTLVPAAPVMFWAMRETFRQRDAASANKIVREEAEKYFDEAVSGKLESSECESRAREIQDALYLRRTANPVIFSFVYDRLRPAMEATMNDGAMELLRRAGIDVSDAEVP